MSVISATRSRLEDTRSVRSATSRTPSFQCFSHRVTRDEAPRGRWTRIDKSTPEVEGVGSFRASDGEFDDTAADRLGLQCREDRASRRLNPYASGAT